MSHIFSNVLPIFLITLLGSVIKRNWITSEEFWRGLENLSYFVLFPIMLFNYISCADCSSGSWIQLVIGLVIAVGLLSIIMILYRKRISGDGVHFTSVFQGVVRYNNYVFFGLSGGLYGKEGLVIASIVSFYMILFTNFLSVIIFARYVPSNAARGITILVRLIRTNPLIIASVAGFLFNYYNIELYIGVKKTLSSLSDAALTVGMLTVGAALKFIIPLKQLSKVLIATLIKLVVLPVIVFAVLSMLSVSGLDKSIGILFSCLPCSSTAYILSRQLGGDPESMASIIMVTVLLSIVTIPPLMYILA